MATKTIPPTKKTTKTPPALTAVSVDRAPAIEQPAFKLTPDEMRLIQAWRKISDCAQEHFALTIEMCTEDARLRRPEPKRSALQLIQGGAA